MAKPGPLTSIDDILNAGSDSDEDEAPLSSRTREINLEALLDSEDEDEEAKDTRPTRSLIQVQTAQRSESIQAAAAAAAATMLPPRPPPEVALRSLRDLTLQTPLTASHAPHTQTSFSVCSESLAWPRTSEPQLDFLGSLDAAEQREQRNLHAAGREVISALQTKRSKPTSSGSSGSATGSSIQYTEMQTITTQLKRNATYKQHGPGTATAVHAHRRFFIVGTSSGLLLLFDTGQEIRQVIGSSAPAGSRCTRAVTAIDATPSGALLVAGYATGEICAWDVAKGTALKRVTDVHSCRITRLLLVNRLEEGEGSSFGLASGLPSPHLPLNSAATTSASTAAAALPSEFTIVSVDCRGVANRGHFTRSLWSALGSPSLSAEFDLLLDGQSGAVPDTAVLQPYACSPLALSLGAGGDVGANIVGAGGAGGGGVGVSARAAEGQRVTAPPRLQGINFAAFNALTRTYIVQIQPVVRVLHRWAAPSHAHMGPGQGSGSSAVTGADASASSAIDWSWQVQAPTRWPVLARAWGDTVQLLLLRVDASARSPISPSGQSAQNFLFSVIAERSRVSISSGGEESADGGGGRESGSVVTLKWLDGDRLVLLSTTHITVLSAQLVVLERCPLAPALATGLASLELFAAGGSDAPLLSFHLGPTHAPNTHAHNAHNAHSTSTSTGSGLYLLSPDALQLLRVQTWTQQADALIREGRWLEALAHALQSCGHWADAAPGPGPGPGPSPSSADLPAQGAASGGSRLSLERYIRRYVDLAISQAALPTSAFAPPLGLGGASTPTGTPSGSGASAGYSTKSHYHLVAGVCIEYCLAARLLPLLWGDIFQAFVGCQREGVFFQALEPFVLSRGVREVPAGILESMLGGGWEGGAGGVAGAAGGGGGGVPFAALERCIVHLDFVPSASSSSALSSQDLSRLAQTLLDRRCYSAYLYLHCGGSTGAAGRGAGAAGEARHAFLSLFARMTFLATQSLHSSSPARRAALSASGSLPQPTPEEAEMAFKMLLFVKYAAAGLVYPRGETLLPSAAGNENAAASASATPSLSSLLDLISMLLSPQLVASLDPAGRDRGVGEWMRRPYPYLTYLSLVDAGAALYCLSRALTALEAGVDPSSSAVDSDCKSATSVALVQLWEHAFRFCSLPDNGPMTPTSPNAPSPRLLLLLGCAAPHLCSSALPLTWDLLSPLVQYASSQPGGQGGAAVPSAKALTSASSASASALATPAASSSSASASSAGGPGGRVSGAQLMSSLARSQRQHGCAARLRDRLEEGNFWTAALEITSSVGSGAGAGASAGMSVGVGVGVGESNAGDVERFERALAHYLLEAGSGSGAGSAVFDFIEAALGGMRLGHGGTSSTSLSSPSSAIAAEGRGGRAGGNDAASGQSVPGESVSARSGAFAEAARLVAASCALLAELDLARCLALVNRFLVGDGEGEGAAGAGAGAGAWGMTSEIIASTAHNPPLQLDILSSIVAHAQQCGRPLADTLCPQDVSAFLHLLARFSPHRLYPFLLAHPSAAVDGCLPLCLERGIVDAAALLLERQGDLHGALSALLLEWSAQTARARAGVEVLLREKSSASPVMDILSKQGNARADAVRGLPSFPGLQHLTQCAIGLCCRAAAEGQEEGGASVSGSGSGSGGSGSSGTGGGVGMAGVARELWLRSLDHFLEEKHAARSGLVSSSSEIIALVIGQLLQLLLPPMKGVIPSQDIVRRITQGPPGHASTATPPAAAGTGTGAGAMGAHGKNGNGAAGAGNSINAPASASASAAASAASSSSPYSEFRDVLSGMLAAYREEISLLERARGMCEASLLQSQAARVRGSRRGQRTGGGALGTGGTEEDGEGGTGNGSGSGPAGRVGVGLGMGVGLANVFSGRRARHAPPRQLRSSLRAARVLVESATLPTAVPLCPPPRLAGISDDASDGVRRPGTLEKEARFHREL